MSKILENTRAGHLKLFWKDIAGVVDKHRADILEQLEINRNTELGYTCLCPVCLNTYIKEHELQDTCSEPCDILIYSLLKYSAEDTF